MTLPPEERRAATEALYRQWHRMVYGLAFAVLHNAQDAEDVVQETFVKVWRHLPERIEAGRLGTWIGRVGLNAAKDARRSQRRRPLAPLPGQAGAGEAWPAKAGMELLPAWVMPARTPEAQVVEREEALTLLAALRPREARVFCYLACTASSQAETAAHLRMPLGTVKTYIHRARLRALQAERGVA